MIEEWERGEDTAIGRLNELMNGSQKIAGNSIPRLFSSTDLQKRIHLSYYDSPGWRYVSRPARIPDGQEVALSQDPLLAYGLPPQLGAFGAINDWIFGIDTPNKIGVSAPEHNWFVTFLPETRAQLRSAEWVPGRLSIEIAASIPADTLQLQALYEHGERKSDLLGIGKGPFDIDVPPSTREIHLFLMHSNNECLAQLHLPRPYQAYGKQKESFSRVQQAMLDLAGGENDFVEYKPFIAPKDEKENEIVETVIAFGNSGGGRIYIGVTDDGTPQGERMLRSVFRSEPSAGLETQKGRVRGLVRERTKPVLAVSPEIVEVHGYRLIMVEVDQGSDPPYSTHENKVFVRKGATNKLADPQADLRPLLSNQNQGWG
jgi:hypothetical protein